MCRYFRKAKLEDRAAIIEVVNAAYAVETGCTGISFKNMPRYVVDSNQDGGKPGYTGTTESANPSYSCGSSQFS